MRRAKIYAWAVSAFLLLNILRALFRDGAFSTASAIGTYGAANDVSETKEELLIQGNPSLAFLEGIRGTVMEYGKYGLFTGLAFQSGWTVDDHGVENRTYSRRIIFCSSFSSTPQVTLTLTGLDVVQIEEHDFRVGVYASSIDLNGFTINFETCGDNQVYSIAASWIAYEQPRSARAEERIVSGHQRSGLTMNEDWPLYKVINVEDVRFFLTRVTFERPFNEPPNVMVNLSGMDVNRDKNIRVSAYATFIDSQGFDLKIETWADTEIKSVSVSWMAFEESRSHPAPLSLDSRIEIGEFKPGMHSESTWRLFDGRRHDTRSFSRRITFSHPFPVPPAVIVTVSGLDARKGTNLRLNTWASDVTHESFVVNVETWHDTQIYSTGLTWIAFEVQMPGRDSQGQTFACMSHAAIS
mmetsp:Transcript_17689/g.29092  ORF Transcript_17689/g.29092 Transcript_17689/m.29092 type:complete len:411 (+) Transcript_17689:241-1473(+)|eukprot:CAMPEP_0184651296 /NCGR_PEP_ID=MMETSP0308-20130426/8885_1 /TAXON_ID=38269 /ORGANISM="Gloeochaete witrockiana, Strain SAG 46.84" /LENGTH=410 /DNA_ID=CAMNT_0027085413 /DNA_START=168 /DNA_END=1400 /DNA_ORIENTATION=-